MRKIFFAALFVSIAAFAQQPLPTIGDIEVYDDDFTKLVPADAKIEVLGTGFIWSEGPVWVKNGGYLLFSDAPQNTMFKWDEKEGVKPFLKPSGYTGQGRYSDEPGSNGLLINKDGELVACEHGDRRISKMNLTLGGKVTLADSWEGKRLNSPNDICQHSNGTYYFTDPPYGLPDRGNDTKNREQQNNGVYSITPDGTVRQIVADLKRPNGVALSPDEKTLYVSQSDGSGPYIMVYPVEKDGKIGKGKIFFDFSKQRDEIKKGAADGIEIDTTGNIYAGAANGIVIISPQGKALGRVHIGVATSNCAFGDGYLYITAHHYICRVKIVSKQ
ncbi:SMP-30/gluconolactonase/LRE family protein [Flavobacterium rhizosphaerae]|uniref:SMP-30/gluconolactonase/LRE family protein n=1 Tax=Flavobacterium rhizosphaerae TaxID=3163298 RepID=A0ABW8Z0B9_9FLAO